MKNYLMMALVCVSAFSSVALAGKSKLTLEACLTHFDQKGEYVSVQAANDIVDILNNQSGTTVQVSQITGVMKKDDACIEVVMREQKNSSTEDLAQSVHSNLKAVPAAEVTAEAVQGLIGYMMSEN